MCRGKSGRWWLTYTVGQTERFHIDAWWWWWWWWWCCCLYLQVACLFASQNIMSPNLTSIAEVGVWVVYLSYWSLIIIMMMYIHTYIQEFQFDRDKRDRLLGAKLSLAFSVYSIPGVCMYVCTYVWMYHIYVMKAADDRWMDVCMYVCMYVWWTGDGLGSISRLCCQKEPFRL